MRRAGQRWTTLLGAALLLAVVLAALLAPVLYPGDPFDMAGVPLLPPGEDAAFPLGTDSLGRDLAAGIAYGARVSLLIGIVSTAAAVLAGGAVGAVAGYYRGPVDDALMRVTELFQVVPPFMLAVVLVTILTPSIRTVAITIALVSWPPVARLVRAEFLQLRERDFVLSCVAIGMSDLRIMATQIMPNALPPVVATATLMVAGAILMEAGLSFLGLGDPNVMSWGGMIGAGKDQLRAAWTVAAFPGLAILVTVLGLNLVGQGVNDLLDPRRRTGRR